MCDLFHGGNTILLTYAIDRASTVQRASDLLGETISCQPRIVNPEETVIQLLMTID